MQTRLILRILLILTDLFLVLMAFYHLKQRRLPRFDTIAWVLFVLCIPYFGPFVCILSPKQQRPQ
ncbi:MAG: hypothetical protein CL609_04090 [Anaerolineaceae bacterium]|nr:hypothetical protein [Anaerolineaceae bacterium]